MTEKTACDGCGKSVNFSVDASVYCPKHDKDFCWHCGHYKECIEGERCGCRMMITNPAWTVNLKNMEPDE